MTRQQEILAL